ncbi:hypothetical protein Vretimale_5689 [Volvox reticuliferus]|uniref:EF-hand domain-containing protein n=1 Tax=Volvox reticuliferus TaxID=1737510 RepID=A0A8J4CBW8_9CHLO|nr:hypothetical protein Vretifemale_5789 [Volvox reticuliferus]GIM00765.1 hypothetical protein Vretimale_5689 [Volvox reticuliferus]
MQLARVGPILMARVAPARGQRVVNNMKGYSTVRFVQLCGVPTFRPVASVFAVFGGNGGSGAVGGGRGGHGDGNPEPGPSGEDSGDGWGRAAAMVMGTGLLLCGEGAAWASQKKTEAVAPPPRAISDELTIEKVTDVLWNLAGPILTNLGFSGCVGAAAGYALKKVGQVVALCVGVAFLFVQGLAYTGFITVNWSNVHSVVTNALDVNKDGKVDVDDFKPIVSKGLGALSQGVPSVGGFLAGFLLALRSF